MKFRITGSLLIALFISTSCSTQREVAIFNPNDPTPDHSGMWLMPQLSDSLTAFSNSSINLHPDDIYDPENATIHNSVVRINIEPNGGGTGSFVSPNGLILTNHHVAYDGIATATGLENNFLQSGFYAEKPDEEIPLAGYTLHIPILQKDVTKEFNDRIPNHLPYRDKAQLREQVRQELIEHHQTNNPDLLVEVNEILSGNRFILSTYKVVRDVRLVYAPEEAIGKFGGDIDNWMWPRHTGDYTFLRAYTAKDGSSEAYQPGNIPLQPEAYLKLNRSELAAGDPIITLGFPGSTYRLESSYAFQYYEKSQFPFLEKAFQAYLNGLELAAERKPAIGQQSASERASIANTLKYFNGVRKGFEQHQITKRKTDFDRSFQEWAEADSLRNLRYGRVLSQLEQSYDIAGQTGDVLYLTFYALQFSKVLQTAALFEDLENRPGEERWSAEQSRERLMLFDSHRQLLSSAVAVAEKAILKDLLHAMAELPFEKRPLVFYRFFEPEESHELKPEIDAFVERRFSSSVLTDTTAARNLFFKTENPSETLRKDSLYVVAADIREMLEQSRENYIRHFPYLQPAQERYVEGITTMSEQKAFQADANFTLRLSFGEIMGFSPEDAVYKFPFTSVAGMVEKHRGSQPFNLPDRLLKHYESETQFHNLPVNFLSTNDITGGNSGSPALNKNGELVGVVFDGNIEGIASDYYFIPNLTRALSVDVRFILFMMEEMDKTERLLNELEIVAD